MLRSSGLPTIVDFVVEDHLNEVEKTLLYISEARDRASRARAALERAGAEVNLVAALHQSEGVLASEHRRLMQRTFFAVPSSDPGRPAS